MLDDRRSSDFAYLAVLVARKNIDLPYYIAVRLKPARRTTINASLGFVSVMAIRAGLRTVALLYPFGLHAFGLGLVVDVLADLPVIPAAYLLVGALPKIHLISRIPHITDSEGIRLALKRYLHYRPADLVLDVSYNPIMLGLKPRLGTSQTLMTTGSARLLADRSGKLCKPFPMALRCMPSGSAGDDSRFLLITHYSRQDQHTAVRQGRQRRQVSLNLVKPRGARPGRFGHEVLQTLPVAPLQAPSILAKLRSTSIVS